MNAKEVSIFKQMWLDCDAILKILLVFALSLVTLLVWMLMVITKGWLLLVGLFFWGVVKMLDIWAKS